MNRQLQAMSTDALITLRGRVESRIKELRVTLVRDLRALDGASRGVRLLYPMRNPNPNAGKKLPVKYRGPEGQTWTGRGLMPNWMKAAIAADGTKREDYAIKPKRRAR